MAKANLGEKQLCPSCGAKFYDLNKRPATCPKCATAFDPSDDSFRLRRSRRATVKDYADDEEETVEAVEVADEEEEIEETPELDADAADEVVLDTDDEEGEASEGDLPPGFSEDDEVLGEDAGGDEDDVPLLEDEEEFNEDELGVPGDDEEN